MHIGLTDATGPHIIIPSAIRWSMAGSDLAFFAGAFVEEATYPGYHYVGKLEAWLVTV